MVQDEDPHRAPPEQARQRRGDGAADQPTERERDGEAGQRPEMKVRSTKLITGSSIRSGAKRFLLPRWVWLKSQPTWAWKKPGTLPAALAVPDVGAVGVALLVGEGVVLAVVGDP